MSYRRIKTNQNKINERTFIQNLIYSQSCEEKTPKAKANYVGAHL